jgi:hypothetical protein
VNGKRAREGLVSGSMVHPGIDSRPPSPAAAFRFGGLDSIRRASGMPPLPSQGVAYYFEGNMTKPELFAYALADDAVAEITARGLPPPDEPAAAELIVRPDGKTEATIWQWGTYALGDGPPVIVEGAKPLAVDGAWRVSFPPDRGAPAAIDLPNLISWHRHADTGVKYFSGTAAYRNTLTIPAGFLGTDKRVVLDLGRVEVVADVIVNGKNLGTLWKEPFRIDVTDAVHVGANELEVRVTNLWANRLIGDEQLPAEYEYGARGDHGILKLPAWYSAGEPKPHPSAGSGQAGDRVTFTTWKFYSKEEPLLESGLLGPVRLLNPVRRVLSP